MSVAGKTRSKIPITRFRNRSIHTYVGHCLLFRGQILQDGEFGVQSGWDTATNDFIVEHLVRLDFLRRKITHNPQQLDIKTLQERARDLNLSLLDDVNDKSPAARKVARPPERVRLALPARRVDPTAAAVRCRSAECRCADVRHGARPAHRRGHAVG